MSAAVIPRGTGRAEGATLAEAAAAIARLVERLTPDRRDPEKFHAEKSEAVRACRRLARLLEMTG